MASSTPLPLAGRVAIVTGASRGIGREIATHLASLGASLILGYSANRDAAEQLEAHIKSSFPSSAIAVKADLAETNAAKVLFDAAEANFTSSRPHILIACAGVLDDTYPAIADTQIEEWDKTFAVNTRGTFLCCREAASRLVRGGGGRIVCLTTSVVASLKLGLGAYAASKAAVETMVKIMAKELKGTGITANCVAPGPIATDMFFAGKTEEMIKENVEVIPLGRLGEPKDVAPLVGFLCTDAGEWINGQVIRVNGGYV